MNSEVIRTTRDGEAGFMLIVVLGFLFVVALITTPFALQARSSFSLSANLMKKHQLTFLADGLMEVVGARILESSDRRNLNLNFGGILKNCTTGRHKIQISIQDHRGLIDLNGSGVPLLKFGFQALSFDSITAENLAKSVVYLRSIEAGPPPLGVFSASASRKFGRFASTLELLDIDTGTKLNHRNIAQVFTVFTREDRLNANLASPFLKRAVETNKLTSLPISFQSRPAIPNGVYTILVRLQEKRSNLLATSSRTVSLGENGKVLFQALETIPNDLSFNGTFDNLGNCSELFGEPVAGLLEKF